MVLVVWLVVLVDVDVVEVVAAAVEVVVVDVAALVVVVEDRVACDELVACWRSGLGFAAAEAAASGIGTTPMARTAAALAKWRGMSIWTQMTCDGRQTFPDSGVRWKPDSTNRRPDVPIDSLGPHRPHDSGRVDH